MKLLKALSLKHLPKKVRFVCLGSVGAFFGMAVYVANMSNALSYLSDEPEACINCHVMTPQYASWKHSSHASISCNDCHVPHDSTLRKYFFKAKDGARHSYLFTLRKESQVMRTTEESAEVIQENCIRCHEGVVEEAMTPKGHDFERSCIECHREVPHGRVTSLSATPNAAVPELEGVWWPNQKDKKTTGTTNEHK